MLLEFTYRFEAAHRFLKSNSIPCMTPHGHTWYATMTVQFQGQALNQSQMSVEFSQVKKQWKQLIQETFDHSYMHNINDPVVEVLNTSDFSPRLLPFPGDPTTEIISLFMFNKMEKLIQASEFAEQVTLQSVKLQETPTNTVVCDRSFYHSEISGFTRTSGWWQSLDPLDRSFYENDSSTN
jgi:6-pyruvoyltetrahydropterin/6-carboxytetrahydropterin synthase